MWILSLVCFTVFLASSHSKSPDILKLCVAGNPNQKASHSVKYCDLLARSKKTQANCVFGVDRLDCLKKVSEQKADFTVLFAEDLLFALQWKDCSVLVVSEIRSLQRNLYESKAVVVVSNGLKNLRNSKLCHPGWASDGDKSFLFQQFLEERLAPQSCSANMTMQEDRIKATGSFFQSICKAGVWSLDKEEDMALKSKYPSMCQLCDQSCSRLDKYWGSGGAAMCLQEGVGNVLWAKYDDVKIHFRISSSSSLIPENSQNFSFFCESGKLQPLSTPDPCFWLARPWPVVVVGRKNVMTVQKMLGLLQQSYNSEWEENLISLLELYTETIINLDTALTPSDYLSDIPGYLSASEMTFINCRPQHEVRWCTTSRIEQEKCLWISGAAFAYAIQPRIDCIEEASYDKCFSSIMSNNADIVVVPPDYQSSATIDYQLNVLLYEKSKNAQNNYGVLAVVKKNSILSNFEDLRGKRACFTKEGGAAWRALLLRLGCQEEISSFFKEVCVAKEGQRYPFCCEDKYFDQDADSAAFRCLIKDGCDVAFIKTSVFNAIKDGNSTDFWLGTLAADDFRVICANKTECSWTNSFPSAIMTASNVTSLKLRETLDILLQLEQKFTKKSKTDHPMFNMFASFFDTKNVLFQVTAYPKISIIADLNCLISREMSLDTSVGFISQHTKFIIPNFYPEIINKTRYCSSATNSHSTLSVALLILPFTKYFAIHSSQFM